MRSGPLDCFRVDAAVGEFQQREGIAAGLGEDAVADPLVHRAFGARVQQRAGVGVVQPAQRQLGQAGQVVVSPLLTGGEDQSQRFGEHPSRHERQRLRGDPVEPLGVVHEAEQRSPGGHVGQQPEHGQADQEPVRGRPRAHPERRGQRFRLRRREGAGVSEEGRAQLVQSRERKLHLRLGTRSPGDPVRGDACRKMIQEGGLSDTGVAAQDEHRAAACLHLRDQPVEHVVLTPPASQPLRTVPAHAAPHTR